MTFSSAELNELQPGWDVIEADLDSELEALAGLVKAVRRHRKVRELPRVKAAMDGLFAVVLSEPEAVRVPEIASALKRCMEAGCE